MSLSISRHSDGSITFFDDFESDDNDLNQDMVKSSDEAKPKKRHTSFVVEGNDFESSTPKFPQRASFGKENESRSVRSQKRKEIKALDTVLLGNQSLNTNEPAKSKNKNKGRKRATMSFEIFRLEEGNHHDESFGKFKTPNGKCEFEMPASPEYEPGAFIRNIKIEEQSECELEEKNFLNTSGKDSKNLVQLLTDVEAKSGNNVLTQSSGNTIEVNQTEEEAKNSGKNFSIEEILKLVPDPWAYFGDKTRDCTGYRDHSLHYLKLKFRKFYNQTINDALFFLNHNLYLVCKYLKKKNRGLKLRLTNRPMSECNACKPTTVSLPFLLEVAFIEQEEKVMNYVKAQKTAKKLRLKEAAKLGLLVECECCYQDGLLREDVVTCNAGHTFCKECIARYIETGIGNGVNQVQCLGACIEEYPLQLLQDLLSPKVFTVLMTSSESIHRADLAQCQFCHYVMYLPRDVSTIKCLNVKCLKVSPRIFNDSNQQSKRCEVTSSSDTSNQCWQCNRPVVKQEGYNELVCSCGGKTCHVCGQPVRNCSHFCLYEDEDNTKCPLYSINYSA